ncbi:MAG: TIGR02530 family flagellar biosynthesis protein [Oscillospiraceae bacterium]
MADIKLVGGLNNVTTVNSTTVNAALNRLNNGSDFKTLLDQQLQKNQQLQFSKHAQERVSQRGINLSQELMDNLNQAVVMARAKGAKDIVVINNSQNNAFIVNVPNNVVVTTMAGSEMKNNIFTNIDSAVLI